MKIGSKTKSIQTNSFLSLWQLVRGINKKMTVLPKKNFSIWNENKYKNFLNRSKIGRNNWLYSHSKWQSKRFLLISRKLYQDSCKSFEIFLNRLMYPPVLLECSKCSFEIDLYAVFEIKGVSFYLIDLKICITMLCDHMHDQCHKMDLNKNSATKKMTILGS